MKKKATSLCLSLLLVFFWLPNLSYAQSEQNISNPQEYTDCGSSEETGGDAPEISQAATTEQAIDICGSISLPCNETAPKGGLSISITTDQINNHTYSRVICNIPEGKNSATYTLSVQPSRKAYYIFYRMHNTSMPYVLTGYFSKNPSHWGADSPSPVYAGKHSVKDIDIVLQKGAIIKGTISLPNNETAPVGGVHLNVSTYSDNGTPENNLDDFSADTDVIINEGMHCSTYSIRVNSNPSRKYKMKCIMPVGSTAVEMRGYIYAYLSDYPSDHQFSIGRTTNALDFAIKKGVCLHGEIYLPDGRLAPAGGTYVYIKAGNDNYWNWTRGTIPEGSNSIQYSLFADPDGVILDHFTYGADGQFQSDLYYSTSGNTPDKDKATLITDFSKPINIEY